MEKSFSDRVKNVLHPTGLSKHLSEKCVRCPKRLPPPPPPSTAFHSALCALRRAGAHLVSSHAVTVEESHLLILLPPHVVDALVGLHIPDLQAGSQEKIITFPRSAPAPFVIRARAAVCTLAWREQPSSDKQKFLPLSLSEGVTACSRRFCISSSNCCPVWEVQASVA